MQFSPLSPAAIALSLPLLLLGHVSAAGATCETVTTNLLSNPSFESGEVSPWSVIDGTGTIISDTSDGGEYALQVYGTTYFGVEQAVTGLTVGETYTLSFDYKLISSTLSGSWLCEFFIETAYGTAVAEATTSYSSTDPTWYTLSASWTATSASCEFIMWAYCPTGVSHRPYIGFDNAQFLSQETVCSSSSSATPTPTTQALSVSSSASGLPSTSSSLPSSSPSSTVVTSTSASGLSSSAVFTLSTSSSAISSAGVSAISSASVSSAVSTNKLALFISKRFASSVRACLFIQPITFFFLYSQSFAVL
ncbi:hypothetical protein ASPZODRAFT_166771 [Penicilliopsis zonata CBS 506.65]|uniref:CBM-cenC domain-containing protein n=1 Tax=Penicilliopsis zonata CBS 506.65 TaxID=1073090 RepID=A0A1L9SH26_9EURO|nr:hypothetical protein ASPZODRAFT_166771 [Penicilliopsis zonata CBS 506.65]OJJ46535.1 hypothetical protein ASPZODRAFT_166771 [Penicilliopsis zonata CBS 506.65]